jgi:hypothetical protein
MAVRRLHQMSSPLTTLSSKDSGERVTLHQHLAHPPLLL